MSFKRDGDNPAMYKALTNKRVVDTLSDFIPNDEAKLCSNGRLTCIICPSQPIFDTMAVLACHRKGKKHLQELTKYLAHKQQLELRNRSSSSQPNTEVTANSYVRKYIKKLPRKHPFSRNVEFMRDNYGATSAASPLKTLKELKTIKTEQKQIAYFLKKTKSPELKHFESGWLKNKDGSWYKNPEVEFDSDDETPPQ